jgi:hypothetical protein
MLQDVPAFHISHYFLSMRSRPTQGSGADDDYYYFLSVIQSTLLVKRVKSEKVKLSLARRRGV